VRLEVSGSSYDSAAEALYGANQVAAMAYDRLKDELAGFHALGGDDTSSELFVESYDEGAQAAVDTLRLLVDGLGTLGDVTFASVQNHRRANADSVYGRPRPSYEGGVPGDGPVTVAAFTPPSSLGGDNADMPDWWNHVVDHLQGFGWPSANTDQLRDAASAWESAAVSVEGLTGKIDVATGMLERQRSPEVPTALSVLGTTRGNVVDLAAQLRALGQACGDYATQVDETRQTIKDLLHDLAVECAVSAGIGVGLSFFTFGGAGVVAGGVIAARAVKYAHRILTALRALRAARAIPKIAATVPKLSKIKSALENLKTARSLVRMKELPRAKMTSTLKQLEKKFKHAEDLGVDLPRGKAGFEAFKKAIDDFLGAPGTRTRAGTYHGEPATIAFNPSTGQAIVLKPDGTFWTTWRCTYKQLEHVIRTGKLGGN
jgi:hypothetical protein